MERFRALPVTQGDSFLLETDDKVVLVDGGISATGIVGLIGATGLCRIDVVVCTHADSDHANGVLGLLENSAAEISEVWLPGDWTMRLKDLCRNPVEFYIEIAQDCSASNAVKLDSVVPKAAEQSDTEGNDLDLTGVAAAFEDDFIPEELPIDELTWAELGLVSSWRMRQQPLWIEAVQTAARIRRIARLAQHRGCRIRWFDFDAFDKGASAAGGEPFLAPTNSVELTHTTLRRPSALEFLHLSTANRRSLVFLSPGANVRSDILFTADSDLAQEIPPLRPGSLATAPHHGSEANAAAYKQLKAVESLVLVRSDGRFKDRPGASFKEMAATKFCTLCNVSANTSQLKQAVVLEFNGSWRAITPTIPCTCASRA